MIEQAKEAFVIEAEELLNDLEGTILGLEDDASPARIDEVFRALHTVKGSGAMFAHTALSRFTHHVENAFDLVRSGQLEVTAELIDLSLKSRDVMAQFLDQGGDGPESEALLASSEAVSLIDGLSNLTGTSKQQISSDTASPATPKDTKNTSEQFEVIFKPDGGALKNGMRPDLLLAELSELGSCEVNYLTSDIPPLGDLDPKCAYMGWKIAITTSAGRQAIEDVFIFADDADLKIQASKALAPAEASPPAPENSGAKPKKPDAVKSKSAKADTRSESIRVASSRLDEMMDALGELVIAQARLDSVASDIGHQTLDNVVEEVQRLVTSLRDATLSIRMVPVDTVFGKFKRVVRDLSVDLGKNVNLVLEGGQTEVDKNIIDRISEPLVHMIRNSIDHGLEKPETRATNGKTEQGTIWLSARQEGGEILIAIEDDGNGLDTQAIRARAIDRGLIEADDDHTESALHQLIFEPGFSTAATVSAVSGRGVGMDAVRTTIDDLGGQVTVLSKPGKGSRVTLRLPVTMAIIDGLRVRLGSRVFVIPLASVEECVEMAIDEHARGSGRRILQIRDETVPYLNLDTLFGIETKKSGQQRVVIVRVDGARAGLVVDDILGQSQTVIKSLSAYHRDIPGLGGATILGDGSVALILDVSTLVRWAETDLARSKQMVA